jgi:hypothetical protein
MGPVLRFRTIRGEGVMHSEGANRSRRGLGLGHSLSAHGPNLNRRIRTQLITVSCCVPATRQRRRVCVYASREPGCTG